MLPLGIFSASILLLGVDVNIIAAISNVTTVNLGDTATLACLAFGEPDNRIIRWHFNGADLENITQSLIYNQRLTQGGRVYEQSLLQLCSVGLSDAGQYMCIASNGLSSAQATTQLIVQGIIMYNAEGVNLCEILCNHRY